MKYRALRAHRGEWMESAESQRKGGGRYYQDVNETSERDFFKVAATRITGSIVRAVE
jgi:hypothetical protein